MHPVQKNPAGVDARAVRMALDRLEGYRTICAISKTLVPMLELGHCRCAPGSFRLNQTDILYFASSARAATYLKRERQGLFRESGLRKELWQAEWLHSYFGHPPPEQFEANYYAERNVPSIDGVARKEVASNQGRFRTPTFHTR